MRKPRKSRPYSPGAQSIAEQLDRRAGPTQGEKITFSQGLRNCTELLAVYAISAKKDPRAYVKENLSKALSDPDTVEWAKREIIDGEERLMLSTPGIFRSILCYQGQALDRKDPYTQESIFQHVQQCLDEALADEKALLARVYEKMARNRREHQA